MISIEQHNGRLLHDFIYEGDNLLYSEIFRHLKKRLGSYHDAEDVIIETQFKAYLNEDKYDAIQPLKPWLCTIAINAAIDYQRRGKKWDFAPLSGTTQFNSEELQDELVYDPKDPNKNPEQIAIQKEEAELIMNHINDLPSDQRDTIIAYYFKGKLYREIAEESKLPRGTVKSRLHIAKEKLEAKLKVA